MHLEQPAVVPAQHLTVCSHNVSMFAVTTSQCLQSQHLNVCNHNMDVQLIWDAHHALTLLVLAQQPATAPAEVVVHAFSIFTSLHQVDST